MARDDLHFRLRIPENLKARVEAAANANKRSMTAEIVARLERTFDEPPETQHAIVDVERRLDELAARTDQNNLLLQSLILIARPDRNPAGEN